MNNFEGKIPKFNLQGTKDHIDLLNDIKLLSYKNQKQTRYSSLVKYHILVSVDALTKFTTFALLSNKDQDSLATGLKIIAAQSGSPRIWMSDRESSVVSIAKHGSWISFENGLASQGGVTIQFCPAPGSSHQNHSSVERKIQSIKECLGSLDLTKTPMDSVMLQNKLFLIADSLNNIPLTCRIRPPDRKTLGCAITDFITPASLCGKEHRRTTSHIHL